MWAGLSTANTSSRAAQKCKNKMNLAEMRCRFDNLGGSENIGKFGRNLLGLEFNSCEMST